MQELNIKVNVTMLHCFRQISVFLVLLRLFDLSVSPAEREKLSPSKLALVKPVKVQPCRTPNTSASFLEIQKFAKNSLQLNAREHLGIQGQEVLYCNIEYLKSKG